jgi:hypothetical protein
MNPSLEQLTSIYAKWLTINNISQTMSAEDLLYENNIYEIRLTNDQVKFLKSFVNIWCEIDNYDYEDNNKMVWDKMSVCPDTKATTYKYK